MAFIGKITAGGISNAPIAATLYGVCETAANTKVKSVTCADYDLTTPIVGMTIHIKFTYSNTYNGTIQLNINSKGVKNVYKNGTTNIGITEEDSWKPNSIVPFTFDGTNWIMDSSAGEKATYAAASSVTAIGTAAVTGTSTAYARADHIHNITESTITSALGYVPAREANTFNYAGSTTPGGAANLTVNVTATAVNPTATTTNYPIFVTGSGSKPTDIATRLKYYDRAGTAETEGVGVLTLGTATAEGTDGNAYGAVRLYGSGTHWTTLRTTVTDSNRTVNLPGVSGTIYTTGNPPTYEEVGAAAVNHTHTYAGSDSIGGSANTVKITSSTSTESTTYYPTYVTDDGNQTVYASGSLRFRTTTGTAETEGEGALVLGTAVSTGTAKNAIGRILLFGTGTKATVLQPSNSKTARTITFPDATGTVYTTGNPPTYEETGAAAANHTHNYAGSSSPGGSADSAIQAYVTSKTEEASATTYYPIATTTTGDKNRDLVRPVGFGFTSLYGTEETDGYNIITLGTSTGSGSAGNRYGVLRLYGTGTKYGQIKVDVTANRSYIFPDVSGTVYTTGNPPTYEEVGAAATNHAHSLSITTSSGTNNITLAASTKYQLTAGGSTYIFTTPPNTTYTAASSSTAVATAAVTGTSTAYARADHVHSIAKATITSALGYTPVQNAGVTSISTGASNGTINVTTNGTSSTVAIKGLDSAAYTSSDDYLGTVLWSGKSNNNVTTTITPSISSSSTYKRLKIFFSLSNDTHWNSIEVIDPQTNKTFTTSITSQLVDDENKPIIQLAYTIWMMSFTNNQWYFGVNDSGWSHTQEGYTGIGTDTNENTRLVHLRKIVGYKNY